MDGGMRDGVCCAVVFLCFWRLRSRELFDFFDFALDQVSCLDCVGVSEFLWNGDPSFLSHVDCEDDFCFRLVRHYC